MMRDAMPQAMPEHDAEHCPEQTTQRNATQLTHASKTQGENPRVLNAPNPVDKSGWVTAEMVRIGREAAELTPEYVETLCRKFRTEIGGVYSHIADYLEAVHS